MDYCNLAEKCKGIWPVRIEKSTILTYPIMPLDVRVVLVTTEEACNKAIVHIRQYRVTGVDTETKPTFVKGKKNKIALVQVALPGIIYLFRVNIMGIPQSLWNFFEDPSLIKIGMGLNSDMNQLRSFNPNFKPAGFIDLGKIAKAGGIITFGLRNLVGIFLQQRLPKTFQTSNWEAENLGKGQVIYAARDAWACLILFYKMTAQIVVSS